MKFNEGTKSTIDIIVPVTGAGIVFYYLFKKDNQTLQKAGITAAIVGVVLYVLVTQVTKRILGAAQKPADLPNTIDTPGSVDNNGTNPTTGNFNSKSWAKRLYDDISPLNWMFGYGHDAKLYADLILLSNENLIKIYNQWQADYYSLYDNRTLVQAMKDESYPNLINGTNDKVTIILDRYAQLGAS